MPPNAGAVCPAAGGDLCTIQVLARDIVQHDVIVPAGHTLSWQIKPLRNSINFSLWRRTEPLSSNRSSGQSLGKDGCMLFAERLIAAGLVQISPDTRCPGGVLSRGSFHHTEDAHCVLVFDNSFSKQKAKTVSFVLQITPTPVAGLSLSTLSGVLLKKKRKRNQGFARRFFVLNDYTLSYTLSRSSSAIRGSMPLSIAAVTVDPSSLEIFIDSGTRVWCLRALTQDEWSTWCSAIEKARNANSTAPSFSQNPAPDLQIWDKLRLFSLKLENIRDALKALPLPPDNLDVQKRSRFNKSQSCIPFSLQALRLHMNMIEADILGLHDDLASLISRHCSVHPSPRLSTVSQSSKTSNEASDTFFDAYDDNPLHVRTRDNNDETDSIFEPDDIKSNSSVDSDSGGQNYVTPTNILDGISSLSQIPVIQRRQNLPVKILIQPPSLLGLLRKNVGKDLSAVTMPVSANEPLNLLQKLAEDLEYSQLLDRAADLDGNDTLRLLYVAAFATSSFSNMRDKERSIRKPFNPLLGETFELIREDKGFRFIAEKVSHRPPILTCHADSPKWIFTQSQMPTQKFYGKSYEVIPNATVQIHFIEKSDTFIYEKPISYLRNVTMGEKYVEPVGHMNIRNTKTGQKAVITFKAGGMFSGRSEDVDIQVFSANSEKHDLSLHGKWTNKLTTNTGETLWQCGDLVESPETHCGFTIFASQLNQITSLEMNSLPCTDSRLRPDQRMLEEGNYDGAEFKKERVENLQRARRAEMESRGEHWKAQWFEYVDDCWRIKSTNGYWEMREHGFQELPTLW